MKVIIYNGQTKFTVDNISIPDFSKITPYTQADEFLEDNETFVELYDMYNFNITSTRGAITEGEEYEQMSEELEKEIEEGINWRHETIH